MTSFSGCSNACTNKLCDLVADQKLCNDYPEGALMCRQSCGRCLVEKPELPDKDLHGDYCTNIEKYINEVSTTTTTTPATTTTTTGRLTVRSMQSFEFHVGE